MNNLLIKLAKKTLIANKSNEFNLKDTILKNQLDDNDIKREVCGFFGFAIGKVIRIYNKKVENSVNKLNRKRFNDVVLYLEKMRIMHHDAVMNELYCQKYYSPFHAIINRGGLSLVSILYFDFATFLMRKICNEIKVDTVMKKERHNFLHYVKKVFLGDEELFNFFCEVDKSSSESKVIEKHIKRTIFNKLLTLTIHAKCGAIIKQIEEMYVVKAAEMALRIKLKSSTAKEATDRKIVLKGKKNKKRKKINR